MFSKNLLLLLLLLLLLCNIKNTYAKTYIPRSLHLTKNSLQPVFSQSSKDYSLSNLCDRITLYLAGQLGYIKTNMKNKIFEWNYEGDSIIRASGLGDSGMAGRAAFGFLFNPYSFAIEIGYLNMLSNKGTTYHTEANKTKYCLNQDVVDLSVKILFPVDKINFYTKLGVGYLTTWVNSRYNHSNQPSNYYSPITIDKRKFAPEMSIGLSYILSQRLNIDVSYLHIQPIGSNKPGNIDLLSLGLIYSI